jgi:hypothetical protein
MLEEFKKKTSEEAAKSLFELAWGIIKSVSKRTVDEIKIGQALEKYKENYLTRHGLIKVLGMSKPVNLKDIYTNVQIVSPSYRHKEREIEQLESEFRIKRENHFSIKKESGIKVANIEHKLNVLGAPGSGKSTFLKKLGMEALRLNSMPMDEEKYAHLCIPVLIELKRFRNEELNLKLIIQNEFEIAGFPQSEYFISNI